MHPHIAHERNALAARVELLEAELERRKEIVSELLDRLAQREADDAPE